MLIFVVLLELFLENYRMEFHLKYFQQTFGLGTVLLWIRVNPQKTGHANILGIGIPDPSKRTTSIKFAPLLQIIL